MVLLRCCVFLLVLVSWPGFAGELPESGVTRQVLVSVHPLALLVKSAWPQLQVRALVPANQSPHDFSLKPSDLGRVSSADAVVWLGAEFEPYLVKLMAKKPQQVNLSVLPFQSIEHDKHDKHEAHDPHLWLQPEIIPLLIAQVQKVLGLNTPKDFLNRYQTWLTLAKQDLEKSKGIGFVSFHDAFHHWVKYFELKQLEVVTQNPEKPVGTRHVVNVREILASGAASCLFVEPQFQTRLLKKLSQGLPVKLVKIDPMASNYPLHQANFLEFYNSLLKQFKLCLAL